MKYFGLFCIQLCLLAGAMAQKLEITENKKADFGRYSSFVVRDGDVVLVTRVDANEKTARNRLQEAIQEELKSKGYEMTQDSAADLAVSFVAEVIERTEQENLGPLGATPARSGADLDQPRMWTQEVRSGSLVIEVFDSSSNKSVWRSRSEINFRSSDLFEVLAAAVSRNLRKFPKRSK